MAPKLAPALAVKAAQLISGIALLAASPAFAAGGGGGGVPSSDGGSHRGKSPERIAADHYRAGLRARDTAWRHEEKAKEVGDGKVAKRLHGKARQQFEKAIERQRKAIEAAPDMHQAHTSLGYALRRVGRYEEAIASYDRALELEPRYGEAVEYRAEAYLQLDRLDDVKRAWGQLHDLPELAEQLMDAMHGWVTQHRDDPGELGAERIEAFAGWVADQGKAGDASAAAADSSRW